MSEKNKKVVMIVAGKDFKDEEYFVPRQILEEKGTEIKTASNKSGQASGVSGNEVKVDLLVSEINPGDFDAIVFIGGPGALDNLDNEVSYGLSRKTIEEGKILAAICISPVILAKSGVLQGKQATVWSSVLDKSAVKILKERGVRYFDEKVMIDGQIITANGPEAAQEFGEKIGELLSRTAT